MNAGKQSKRNEKGSFMVEVPLALWMLFVLFTFPLLDLATVLLRYTFIVAAARDGVHAAAQSKTFQFSTSPTQQSAMANAQLATALTAAAFSEISVTNVKTQILATDINTLKVTTYNQALATPADQTTNLYEIQTTVTGSIDPLLTIAIGVFDNVPGLSLPVPVTVTAREYCEYPQGLNL